MLDHGCSVWSGWVCPTAAITSNLRSLSGSFECEDRHKPAYQDFKGLAKHAKKDHEGYTPCRLGKDSKQQVEERPVKSRHERIARGSNLNGPQLPASSY